MNGDQVAQDPEGERGAEGSKRRQRTPGLHCDIGHCGTRQASVVGSASVEASHRAVSALPTATGGPHLSRERGTIQELSGPAPPQPQHEVRSTPQTASTSHPHNAQPHSTSTSTRKAPRARTTMSTQQARKSRKHPLRDAQQLAERTLVGSKLAERAGDSTAQYVHGDVVDKDEAGNVPVGSKFAERAGTSSGQACKEGSAHETHRKGGAAARRQVLGHLVGHKLAEQAGGSTDRLCTLSHLPTIRTRNKVRIIEIVKKELWRCCQDKTKGVAPGGRTLAERAVGLPGLTPSANTANMSRSDLGGNNLAERAENLSGLPSSQKDPPNMLPTNAKRRLSPVKVGTTIDLVGNPAEVEKYVKTIVNGHVSTYKKTRAEGESILKLDATASRSRIAAHHSRASIPHHRGRTGHMGIVPD